MNSSGIKRGLATSAVAALAVTGIPALASSASAASGDVVQVGSVGPTLDGGDIGGVVVLKTKGITAADVTNLQIWNTALNDDANTPTQTVAFASAPTAADFVASGAAGDSNPTDGFAEVTVHVAVVASAADSTAHYALVFNDNADATVDAGEARVMVDQTTSGTATKLVVTPATQSTAQSIESGKYTVTLQDAAGKTTQLKSTDADVLLATDTEITLDPNNLPAPGLKNEGALTPEDLELGSATFTATPDASATLGNHTITLDGPMAGAPDATANLNVTTAATVGAANVDIVTGADSWDGFDGGTAGVGNVTDVRVDQGTIRIDIKGATAGGTVTLNLEGDSTVTGGATDVTFGGKKSTTVSTVLDSNGNGSLTITPDAGSIQVGDEIEVTGTFGQTLEFSRAESDAIVPATDPFFTKAGGTVDVTVQVVDQFGNPITTGFVTAARTGANAASDATPQKKAVSSDGTVTFTFTDTKAANGTTEAVDLKYYVDQFATSEDETGTAHIKYTADAMGANFNSTLDTKNTEAGDYDATDVVVVPLADALANDDGGANESAALEVTGGEPGATMKISVDNDALILAPGKTALSDGKASVTATLDALTGNLTSGYKIIGTKSGVVTVTMTAANRTETAQFTVSPELDRTTARSVTVSGPAEVESGSTQVTYTAVVTDAFGNPVANVPVTDLNIQVAGPAQFQDSDAVTNADGQISLNVRLDSDAEGDVTVKVQGIGQQFGAGENRLTSASTTDDAKGLPASSNAASATTTVKPGDTEPEGPVYAHMKMQGIDKGKRDVIKLDARDEAAGATVKLFKRKANGSLKKIKTAVMNDAGNFTFRVHDGNGMKATRYTVKLVGNDAVRPANKSRRIK